MENLIYYFIAGFVLLDLIIVFYVLQKRRKKSSKFNHSFYKTHWQSIENTFKFSPDQAIIEADKLFDHAMKDLGYTGTFVDKFKKAQEITFAPQLIWDAHKLRNNIAHQPGFKSKSNQSKMAISAFRRGLLDFGVKL